MRSFVHIGILVCSFAWTVTTNAAFAKLSSEKSSARTPVQRTDYDGLPDARKTADSNYVTDLPAEFDARQHFVKCSDVIGDIKDQGNCASSWAVAVASSFTDRLCIKTDGKFTKHLSAQNLMSCGAERSTGCGGGSAFKAWEHTMTKGIVTGGHYGSNEGCQPYQRSTCDHFGVTGGKNCSSEILMVQTTCDEKCSNENYGIDYNEDLHKTSSVYMTSWTNVKQIQQEIATYGPVTAFMYVYENFLSYKRGVYKSTAGRMVGYQYVKLIGWGVDEVDGEYWLAMNSWNNSWGECGFFKILRGYNLCSIELLVMAGTVQDVSR
ncbi:cathepsin B-like cysteine proteinase 3 [Sipha flava]|uniref:Cathepsin B-like cysteine proteinase 3 n=1 Tax=Sipha flava TaxID=143950 RepID=A0A8B8F5E6_9HEMI|nr:cathepsin B-like cysteine proteinase 3 [Sipha flava]